MTYRFLDDIATADIAFEAAAHSLEELFSDAANALAETLVEHPERIERRESIPIELADNKIDLLLYHFLQEIIYLKDARHLLLLPEDLAITQASNSTSSPLVGNEPSSPSPLAGEGGDGGLQAGSAHPHPLPPPSRGRGCSDFPSSVSNWVLKGTLSGEPIDTDRHVPRLDVKAVTLHELAVHPTPHGWVATVVLDV